MRRAWIWLGLGLGLGLGFLVLGALLLVVWVRGERFRPAVEARLSQTLGRKVSIGALEFSIFRGSLSARGLVIGEARDFGQEPFLRAVSVDLGLEWWPLLVNRRLVITDLTIRRPEARMVRTPDGAWNFATLGAQSHTGKPSGVAAPGSAAPEFDIRLVRLEQGRLQLFELGQKTPRLGLEEVELELRDVARDRAFPFSMTARVSGGGKLTLTGTAGPLNVPSPPWNVALEASQIDLHQLAQAEGWQGTLSLNGGGTCRQGVLTAAGKAEVKGLKVVPRGKQLAQPLRLEFSAEYDLNRGFGSLERGALTLGRAMAQLAGRVWRKGDSHFVDLELRGSGMPLEDLAQLLGPVGLELPRGSKLESGSADLELAIRGLMEKPVFQGTVSLEKARLAGFDMGSRMQAIAKLAGIESKPATDIETLGMRFAHSAEGTVVEDLNLMVPRLGELRGSGRIGIDNSLDFRMTARLASELSSRLSGTPLPFLITGTVEDPAFRPDLGAVARSQAGAALEAGRERLLKSKAGEAAGKVLEQLLGQPRKQ